MIRRGLGAFRATFRSLSVRNFRLFFTGQLISQVGNWLTSVALILLILHRTQSGIAVGLLTAAQFGPILLLGAWAGLRVAVRAKTEAGGPIKNVIRSCEWIACVSSTPPSSLSNRPRQGVR